ncbi:hypothetical protein GCK72_006585 [Caenorhabditis remanei]|uniref:F-box associated domain-containing protein n=1 Tax=Caenorhabditis remanei TaxID=31234 RepID=A0A6A5HJ48_CAERE|nr:hypothetical protein GCK72_006585 [Caenorhabditis remanei]KAF1766627.1 hypothetical protein GCK72_006585 [Caenorhabditis remanei]
MHHTPTYSVFGLEEPGKMSYALVEDLKRNDTTMLTWTWKSQIGGRVREERSWLKSKDIDFPCKIIFEPDSTALLWCHTENQASRKRFATALHSHMCEVFRVEPEMQFKLFLDYMDELPYTNTVRDVALFDTSVNSNVVDEFLERFQVTRVLFSKTMRANNPLKNSNRLNNLNNLFFCSAPWLNGSKLLRWNFENLVVYDTGLMEHDLINFVNVWLNGNNTKLQTFIQLGIARLNNVAVVDHFELEPWNPEVDQLEYKLPVRDYCEYLLAELNETTMERTGVLVRQSDGLRAVLRASIRFFHFHVLHD